MLVPGGAGVAVYGASGHEACRLSVQLNLPNIKPTETEKEQMDDEPILQKQGIKQKHTHTEPGSGKYHLPPEDPSPLPPMSLRARFVHHSGLLRLACNSGPHPSPPAPGQA